MKKGRWMRPYLRFGGSPCWTRTNDLAVNSRSLLPTELRRIICNLKKVRLPGRWGDNSRASAVALPCFGKLESGNALSSQAVSSSVLSARKGLTSVFGMRTGGSLSLLSPEWLKVSRHLHNCLANNSVTIAEGNRIYSLMFVYDN